MGREHAVCAAQALLASLPLRPIIRALLLLDDDLVLPLDDCVGRHGRHDALLLEEGAGRQWAGPPVPP